MNGDIERRTSVVMGDVVCGVEMGSCICSLPPGHDGPHHCQDAVRCGGQWYGSDGSDFWPVRFPGGLL